MPRNHNYEEIIQQPTELAVMDLNDAAVDARTVSAIASRQILVVDDLVQDGKLWIDGEVEDGVMAHLMEANLEQIREEMLYMAEIANELAAQHAALLEAVKMLKRQRDTAIAAKMDSITRAIAEHHFVTEEQAEKLLSLLICSADDLLEADRLAWDVLDNYSDQVREMVQVLDLDME